MFTKQSDALERINRLTTTNLNLPFVFHSPVLLLDLEGTAGSVGFLSRCFYFERYSSEFRTGEK